MANRDGPCASVPYTGGDEFFSVKMDIDKVKEVMDDNGNLLYSRIFNDQQGRVPT